MLLKEKSPYYRIEGAQVVHQKFSYRVIQMNTNKATNIPTIEETQMGIHTFDMKVELGTSQFKHLSKSLPLNALPPKGLTNPFNIPGIQKLFISRKANHFGYFFTLVIEPQALLEKQATLNLFDCTESSLELLQKKLNEHLISIDTILDLNRRKWYLARIDYATQLKFDHTELYIDLARRAAVPYGYRPKYIGEFSSYTQCKSVCHNFYFKYRQLLAKKASKDIIAQSEGLYRTEIQILTTEKIKDLSEKYGITIVYSLYLIEI